MRIERLCDPSEAELRALEALWEASVRATHDLLNDRDVVALRPEVRAGLSSTALYVARDAAGRPFPILHLER